MNTAASGVTLTCTEFGKEIKREADYLVSCISLVALRQIAVSPAWPEAKAFVIREMPYYTRTRVVFQTRTRFWKTDKVSPNWMPPDPRLNELWSMAEEVNTPRGILLGGAQAGVPEAASLAAFHKLYPGQSANIEHVLSHDWSKDRYAGMCERTELQAGRSRQILARGDASRRANSFRGSLCGSDVLGAGGGFGIGQPRRRCDSSRLERGGQKGNRVSFFEKGPFAISELLAA